MWLTALLLAVGTAIATSMPAPAAAADRPSPDEVEAAYLFNFGRFVRWPENAIPGPMTICVAGDPSVAATLKRIAGGEQLNGHPVEVRTPERPDAASGCEVLYIGGGPGEKVESFLHATEKKPILTVGESPDFLDRGGIVQFVVVEDHVRFAVNLDAAGRNGLTLSSELLKVAVRVRGSQSSGGVR